MNKNNLTVTFFVLVISLSISGCGAGQPFGPTTTPTPTNTSTSTPTLTSTPTIKPSPVPTATSTPILGFGIDIPATTSGYDIKIISVEKVDEYVMPRTPEMETTDKPAVATANEGNTMFVIKGESTYGFEFFQDLGSNDQATSDKAKEGVFFTYSDAKEFHDFIILVKSNVSSGLLVSIEFVVAIPDGTTLTSLHLPEGVVIDLTSFSQ